MAEQELRELFIFDGMTDEQIDWLERHGRVQSYAADEVVYREGEQDTCFVVLIEGTMAMSRQVRGGEEIEVSRSSRPGTYAGSLRALFRPGDEPAYTNTVRAVTPCHFYQIPVDEFGAKIREWFPMGVHLVSAIFSTMIESVNAVSQRERLIALGSLTAGLTHELNNPAAAAVRATDALSQRLVHLRSKLAILASKNMPPDELMTLVELQNTAVAQTHQVERLSPMETADREDELTDWLDDHGVPNAVDIAATLVGGGLDVAWADKVGHSVQPDHLPSAITWLAYTVETETLLSEIADSTRRISELLASARQYTQMDRAPVQRVDVRSLLDATLAMLAHKIPPGIAVVKDYAEDVPDVDVYAAELNQVWTNIIDNALDAMSGEGTLTVRARSAHDGVVVEICDTGPGVPEEIRDQIFAPFFSTKEVGRGTGLGLDISWRIIVKKHHGDLRVRSRPGDTRFIVSLPRRAPAAAASDVNSVSAGR